MKRFVDWLDQSVDNLAKWLNDNISGQHLLAVAGGVISGVDPAPRLPWDRRIGPNILLMAEKSHQVKKGETVIGIAKKYGIKDWRKDLWDKQSKKFLKDHPDPNLIYVGDVLVIPESEAAGVGKYADKGNTNCNFWALCYMSGYPCTRCGGDNGFDGKALKCPSGTKQGHFWQKCCKDPGGTARYLQFYDCCSKGAASLCGSDSKMCANYDLNVDWCTGVGAYNCTAILHSPDKDRVC
jgi:hypothetical protein